MRERLPNLAREAEPASASRKLLREAAAAFFGALALAAAAKWQVPFYPVPMTLQTLVVLILGAFFGARLASATVGLYLAEGFFGLPVFAGWAAGPETLAGPTGGYLFGFLAAAALVGLLAERGVMRSLFGLIVAMCLGHVVISAFGFGWLAAGIGPVQGVGDRRGAVLLGHAVEDGARGRADARAGAAALGAGPCAITRAHRLVLATIRRSVRPSPASLP